MDGSQEMREGLGESTGVIEDDDDVDMMGKRGR
jgi:hypothetical protein